MSGKAGHSLLSLGVVLVACNWAAAQPTITAQPTNSSVSLGATAQFTASFRSSSPPMTYQWWFKDTALNAASNPSAVKNTLLLANVTLASAGPYFAVASDATGSVTSKVAVLEVDPTFVKITSDPVTRVGSRHGAWGDYNQDGSLDLLVGGDQAFLFLNNHDGTFRQATRNEVGSWIGGDYHAIAWTDYNNDGWLDVSLGYPSYRLLKSSRDGTMVDVGMAEIGLKAGSTGIDYAFWADFNNDGYLDVFSGGLFKPREVNYLFTNDGTGRFTQMAEGELATTVSCGFAVSASDYDNDGYLDLLVSDNWWFTVTGSRLPPYLWHNNGDGTFSRVIDSPISAHPRFGTGSVWGDYNNDGTPDLFTPDCSNDGFSSDWYPNKLFRNDGGTFTEITEGPIPNEGGLSIAGAWGDCDNDGFLDLFVTNLGPSVNGENTAAKGFLYHNNGDGTFTKVTTGSLVNDLAFGWDASWADYDNDGFLDLYRGGGNFLYHNNGPATGNTNAWIIVNLRGTRSNSFGVGAKVRLWAHYRGQDRQQLREVIGGNGLTSGPPLYAHFGLGDATNVTTLRVEWPSGAVQTLANVTARQSLTIWEPPALKAAIQEDGACLLNITAQPNRTWRIEASADLKTWQKLAPVSNSTFRFGYTDTASAALTCRFYRVVAE